MTLNDLRRITNGLPGKTKLNVVVTSQQGGEHALRTVTMADGELLLCDSNEDVGPRETVLYDATPEPRMD